MDHVNDIKLKAQALKNLRVPLGVLKMDNHRYPHGGVDYVFDHDNDKILKNICSIFICLEDELKIPHNFIYYTKIKHYNNMFIILYNLKNTLLENYNSCKNIILENKLIFLEYTTILQYLHANIPVLKRKR